MSTLRHWKPGFGATAWDNASNYMGADLSHMLCAPCTTHRDAGTLQRSNWEVQLRTLRELDPDEELHEVHEFNNWAVGWTACCLIAPQALALRLEAERMAHKIGNYPILDEDHHSELEWTEVADYWEQCSVSERLDYIQRANSGISPFAARHAWIPQDDNGTLFEYLRD